MRASIIDLAFPLQKQASRGLAAQWLGWELSRRAIAEFAPGDADILLVTSVDPIQFGALARLRKRYSQKIIVCGGAASTSPSAIGHNCDMIVVGDGKAFVDTLCSHGIDMAKQLPNVWVDGETRVVSIDQGFPWECPPIKGEDGAVHLWCGRGCKKRCLFCQTGWAMSYSEHPNPEVLIAQARGLKNNGERVNYLSNDLAQHSFANRLPHTDHGSYSLDYLRRFGLPPARQVRLGVEGVSEGLRLAVGKPISTDDLVNCTSWLNANGHSVRWFMIAGLPGETANDWEELKEVVQRWKAQTPKGVLALSFTAFVPEPATPLGVLPLDDDYWPRWESFREWFFGGAGWSNRVKVMAPAAPAGRLKRAMAAMDATEAELRRGWFEHDNLNWRVQYQASPDKLRAMARKYMERMAGMGLMPALKE